MGFIAALVTLAAPLQVVEPTPKLSECIRSNLGVEKDLWNAENLRKFGGLYQGALIAIEFDDSFQKFNISLVLQGNYSPVNHDIFTKKLRIMPS
jgi:hypothetical protein